MRDKAQKAAYQKRYYAANKARLSEQHKAWYRTNRKRAITACTAYSARRLTEPLARAQYLVRAARDRAKRKGLECTITAEEIVWQIELGICAVTGIPFNMETRKGRHPFTPSVDRIDHTLGYVSGNVRVIIWALNAMRGTWGDEVLLQVADALRGAAR